MPFVKGADSDHKCVEKLGRFESLWEEVLHPVATLAPMQGELHGQGGDSGKEKVGWAPIPSAIPCQEAPRLGEPRKGGGGEGETRFLNGTRWAHLRAERVQLLCSGMIRHGSGQRSFSGGASGGRWRPKAKARI